MKPERVLNPWFASLLLFLMAIPLFVVWTPAAAEAPRLQIESPTATETGLPSETPTPTATNPPVSSGRALLVVDSYNTSGAVRPGSGFDLRFRLYNAGTSKARNVVAVFGAGEFSPRNSGGVIAAGTIDVGASTWYTQSLYASESLQAGAVGKVSLQVNYVDEAGESYSESFTLSLVVGEQATAKPSNGGSGARPTATPTPAAPQLLIEGYRADVDTLMPGTRFSLNLRIRNVGESAAKRVSMVLGGGTAGGGSNGDDPGAGPGAGLSGAGGDFGTFAPLGSSNVQYLGDLAAGKTLQAGLSLIVNSSAKPGAYTMRISLIYSDENGNALSDEQVISLLVVLPPRLEVSFYRPPDPFFVGQPGSLPLQVVNLDRNSVILGRLTVIADGAQVENASVLVGALDPGGFFSHDALLIPPVPGPLQVQARLDYVDDFNQAQSILVELPLEVLDAPPFDPGSEEPIPIDPASEPESGLQKVWRLVLGLLGLDSGRDEGGGFVTPDGEFPPDEGFPIDGPSPLGPGPKGG